MKCNHLFIQFLIMVGSFLLPNTIMAQLKSLPFEQVQELQKNNSKWQIILVHTQWCKYCKAMENTTFRNKKVVSLLNEKFYFTSFDAEEKREISFNGKTFRYLPNGKNTGIHQLNDYLSNGKNQEVYPRLVFLSPNGEKMYFIEGFISAKDLEKVLLAPIM